MNRKTCYIFGEGRSLLLSCAELLLQAGVRIIGIITKDIKLQRWATEKKIKYYESQVVFIKQKPNPVDFIFSIINPEIIPSHILRLAKSIAINYHNGPLPRYAGMFAPSWAILNGEIEYGITWHVLTNRVDCGDILKQAFFPINKGDTSFMVNLKCQEAAKKAFSELLLDLDIDSFTGASQDLSTRTYFSKYARPFANGVIQFNNPSEEIIRLINAGNYSYEENRFFAPKIILNGNVFIIKSAYLTKYKSKFPSGWISKFNQRELYVATGDNDLRINSIYDYFGEKVPIAQLETGINGEVRYRLNYLSKKKLIYLDKKIHEILCHENFWVEKLEQYLRPSYILGQTPLKPKYFEISFPKEFIRKFRKLKSLLPDNNNDPKLLVAAIFFVYLYKITDIDTMPVFWSDRSIREHNPRRLTIFSQYLPLLIKANSHNNFLQFVKDLSDNLLELQNRKTFLLDNFYRYNNKLKDIKRDFKEGNIFIIDFGNKLSANELKSNYTISFDLANNNARIQVVRFVEKRFQLFDTNFVSYLIRIIEQVICNPNITFADIDILNGDATDGLNHRKVNQGRLAPYPQQSGYIGHGGKYDRYVQKNMVSEINKLKSIPNYYETGLYYLDKRISFAELDSLSALIASYIINKGQYKKADLIGVFLCPSIELVLVLFGIVRAGKAFLPLDPDYPEDRLSYMIRDSKCALIITNEKFFKKKNIAVPEFVKRVVA